MAQEGIPSPEESEAPSWDAILRDSEAMMRTHIEDAVVDENSLQLHWRDDADNAVSLILDKESEGFTLKADTVRGTPLFETKYGYDAQAGEVYAYITTYDDEDHNDDALALHITDHFIGHGPGSEPYEARVDQAVQEVLDRSRDLHSWTVTADLQVPTPDVTVLKVADSSEAEAMMHGQPRSLFIFDYEKIGRGDDPEYAPRLTTQLESTDPGQTVSTMGSWTLLMDGHVRYDIPGRESTFHREPHQIQSMAMQLERMLENVRSNQNRIE